MSRTIVAQHMNMKTTYCYQNKTWNGQGNLLKIKLCLYEGRNLAFFFREMSQRSSVSVCNDRGLMTNKDKNNLSYANLMQTDTSSLRQIMHTMSKLWRHMCKITKSCEKAYRIIVHRQMSDCYSILSRVYLLTRKRKTQKQKKKLRLLLFLTVRPHLQYVFSGLVRLPSLT